MSSLPFSFSVLGIKKMKRKFEEKAVNWNVSFFSSIIVKTVRPFIRLSPVSRHPPLTRYIFNYVLISHQSLLYFFLFNFMYFYGILSVWTLPSQIIRNSWYIWYGKVKIYNIEISRPGIYHKDSLLKAFRKKNREATVNEQTML